MEDCKHSIESEGLEQWMNQNDEEITLKQCPLCKTPILKTQRFMNQVKIVLEDISKIKRQQLGELTVLRSNKKKVLNSLTYLNDKFYLLFIGEVQQSDHIKNQWHKICKPLVPGNRNINLPPRDIESLNFVTDLFKDTSVFKNRIKSIKDKQMKQAIISHFVWLLSVAFEYARQLSNQQKFDINMEMARGARMINLFEIKSNETYQTSVKMRIANAIEVKDLVDNLESLIINCHAYSQDRDIQVQNNIEIIEQKMAGISVITDEERRMIHKAMSVSFASGIRAQGHWCKCPNGHIYCITECGGPMQESVCPECKVKIGGQSHRHVSGITVASEMDGANHLMFQT